jgi:hypothetical protein
VTTEEPAVEPVEPPLLRILTPAATDEEVASLVAFGSAMAAAGAEARAARPTPVWWSPARSGRTTLRHGSGAWRASGLP